MIFHRLCWGPPRVGAYGTRRGCARGRARASRDDKAADDKVTHVVLERQPPFGNALQFRVYISGTRKSASVSYDAKGTMKRVWK